MDRDDDLGILCRLDVGELVCRCGGLFLGAVAQLLVQLLDDRRGHSGYRRRGVSCAMILVSALPPVIENAT